MLGRKFGSLTVVEQVGMTPDLAHPDMLWRCQCDCGGERVVRGEILRMERSHTCMHCQQITDEGQHMKCTTYPNGRFFIFDREDLPIVEEYHWQINETTESIMPTSSKLHNFQLCRLIARAGEDVCVTHVNGLFWDLRHENLRLITHEEKRFVRHVQENDSGYKGVSYDKRAQKYRARITLNHRTVNLGSYDTARKAADAYDQAALEHFGDLAWTNAKERAKNALLLELGKK
jgi:uncharacterized protein YifE (UPF0438 family)